MIAHVLYLLPWVLPPVLGALIGYVTNAVAIRMLFRPHREWRVLGVRVPLTPGIIPRQRGQLAVNIARMVSQELLTEDAVQLQTSQESFRAGIRSSISGLTRRVLAAKLSDVVGVLSGKTEHGADGLGSTLNSLVRSFFTSDTFRQISRSILEEGIRYLMSFEFRQIFGEGENRTRLIARFLETLDSETTRKKAEDGASSWMSARVEEDLPVGNLLPESLRDRAIEIAERVYQPVAGLLVQWLRQDDMKAQLEMRGRFLLHDVFARLSAFQRMLVTATQYDRTLDENMGDIVADALDEVEALLDDPQTKAELLSVLRREVSDLWDTGIGELNTRHQLALPDLVRGMVSSAWSALEKNGTRESLVRALGGFATSIEDRTIESVLEGVLSVEDAADFLSSLVEERLGVAVDGERTGVFSDFLRSVLRDHQKVSLAVFLGVNDKLRARIDEGLTELAIDVIRQRVPALLASLDIHNLVVSKINGLNVEQVEGLLLRVIHRHLRWINVFGAILGFVIGLTQLVSRLFL